MSKLDRGDLNIEKYDEHEIHECRCLAQWGFICSNYDTCEFNTRECVEFVGHNFLGWRSHDLGIWQDFSPVSPQPSYTYERTTFKQ